MTIVLVTGASGVLGRSLIARPEAASYAVHATSRHAGASLATHDRVEWRSADLLTGMGLDEAMRDVDVVIHAASAPRGDTRRTDVDGTARLIASAQRARVQHLLYVSIVGIDRVPVRYYRHKLAAEMHVRRSRLPWTIVRGTQFHSYMDFTLGRMARLPVAFVPRGFLCEPILVDEFAEAIWQCVAAGPRERVPDVAGPQVLTYEAMMRAWLSAQLKRKPILAVPIPGRIASSLRRGESTAPDHAVGRMTWAEWLQAKYAARRAQMND